MDIKREEIQKYQKYTYWLNENNFSNFQNDILKRGITLYRAVKAVCVPLSKRVDIGVVEPDVWDKFDICRRQMSWYRESHRAGLYLVVSSFELNDYGLTPETIIKESGFAPSKLPDKNQQLEMIKRQSYADARPDEWEDIASADPALVDKWMRVMGIRRIAYKELFVTHCANHANFIEPEYNTKEEGIGIIPYSISEKTHFICSACLELYNIIGPQFRKKYIVPCPGSAIFAGLPVNRYFEVITPS